MGNKKEVKKWVNNFELHSFVEHMLCRKGITCSWEQMQDIAPGVYLQQADIRKLIDDYENMIQIDDSCAKDLPPLVKDKLKLPDECLKLVGKYVGGKCKYKRQFQDCKYHGQEHPHKRCRRYSPLVTDLDLFDEYWLQGARLYYVCR